MKKSFMSKSLALVLAFVMIAAVALTGCGKKASDDGSKPTTAPTNGASNGEATNTPTDGEFVLDISVGPEPETIDPTLNTSVDGATLINHTFEGLMKINAD